MINSHIDISRMLLGLPGSAHIASVEQHSAEGTETRPPLPAIDTDGDEQPETLSVLLVSEDAQTRAGLCARLVGADAPCYSVEVASSQAQAAACVSQRQFHIGVAELRQGEDPADWLKALAGGGAAVVVVGQHATQAVAAFDLGAVDFVLRDAEPQRLQAALRRAALRSSTADHAGLPRQAAGVPRAGKRWMRVMRNGELLAAPIDEALYFRAERKLTRVVFRDADGFLHMGINTVARELDGQQFWRIHRGTIINAQHIGSVRRDEFGRVQVRMRDSQEPLQVSQPYEHLLYREGFF
jgi:DNA-binding LytR/AlgR family response regulator